MSEWRTLLKAFAALEPDWDSYGGMPIPQDVISRATHLIERIGGDVAQVFPLNGGGVQVEWKGPAQHIEVEVYDDAYGYLVDFMPAMRGVTPCPPGRFEERDTVSEDEIAARVCAVLSAA